MEKVLKSSGFFYSEKFNSVKNSFLVHKLAAQAMSYTSESCLQAPVTLKIEVEGYFCVFSPLK